MKNICTSVASLGTEARNILSLVQKNGPLTKNSLMLLTGMKLSTLNRMMLPLEKKGIIVPSGIEESTGGRRPALYDIHPEVCYAVGIDISRTYTKVVITNLKMNILGSRELTADGTCTPEKTVEWIPEAVGEILLQSGLEKGRLLGAGLGTVGPLDRKRGVMTNPSGFTAPGWQEVPIQKMLEEKLKLPVVMDNGANAAVLAEYLFGSSGRSMRSIAYIHCGIGIRTGAISSGIVVRTANDAEDVFAHMVIDVDGEPCFCGNYGCIECYSSISAIERKFRTELKKGRSSIIKGPPDAINFAGISSAAEENDSLASDIITGAAVIFGTGLANYINLLNPQMVILSGPLIKSSGLFYRVCTETAMKKCYGRENNKVIFSKYGYFKDHAISAGSAAMFLEELLHPGKW